MTQRIAVIGAGVLGLSLARSLAFSGAKVTVFEQNTAGSGTSQISFAWINSNGKTPESYHQLNVAGIDEHKRLQRDASTSTPWLLETGTWEWATDEGIQAQLEQRAEQLNTQGYTACAVQRKALLAQFPELRLDPRIQKGWYFPTECLLYPSLFIARLLADIRSTPTLFRQNSEVVSIEESAHAAKLTLASGESWEGDQVVIATGRWSPELSAQLGWQLDLVDANVGGKRACSLLARTSALPLQINSNIMTPELNIRPDGGGRLLLQALDLDDHTDPARSPALDGLIGKEFLRRLRRLFINTEGARIEQIETGQRALPADGLPAVGYMTPLQRTYLLVTHSGMTLAPILSRLVTEEMIKGDRSTLLASYAPQRVLKPLSGIKSPSPPAYLPSAQ